MTISQRTASTLSVYRVHTQHVHCVHAKNRQNYGTSWFSLGSLGKGLASGKPRLPLLTHSLAQKHCRSERFTLTSYRQYLRR